MGLTASFTEPYFIGSSSVSAEVPYRYHVAFDGRPFMVDTKAEYRQQSIPLLRNQADTSSTPGEASINPEGLWRRAQVRWDGGAGQTYLDRAESDPSRFRQSKGMDVWTRWELSLLHDTAQRRATVASNVALAVAGTYLYVLDGAVLYHTQNINTTPTWTMVTGLPGTATSVVSNGYNIFTAHGSSGVYSTVRGSGTAASYTTLNAEVLGYAKSRLLVAYQASIYNPTPGALNPTALFTHPNTDFRWVGFAEGQTVIYAAGFSGDKSLIYRIGVKEDGTGLDVPIVAGELPDGEVVRSITGYVGGLILIGTSLGLRIATQDGSGNLTIGPALPVGEVYAAEPQDRFAWYGWSNYDTTSTGLGRVDLQQFTASLTPAYASDLMVTGQGLVRSIVTFGNRRVFTVAGLGVYAETDTCVPSGTLDTGYITYGVADPKVAQFVDVRFKGPLVGAHSVAISTDYEDFISLGTKTADDRTDTPYSGAQTAGEALELRHTLTCTGSASPVMTRWTLRAKPTAIGGSQTVVPLIIADSIQTVIDEAVSRDPQADRDFISALRNSRRQVTFQEGTKTTLVFVDDFDFNYIKPSQDRRSWIGTLTVKLTDVSEGG